MNGKIFQVKLRELGIKQNEVAKILGVTEQAVSAMMRASSIKTSTLEKIASAFGKDMSMFFNGEELDQTKEIETLRALIKSKDDQIERLNRQVESLLRIIEKMQ